jgi:FkbM family methyltransferase
MFGTGRARALALSMRRPLFEALGSDRYSHLALNGLDHKLKRHLDFDGGTFIEAGGNDGLTQSNTYWFERFRNWRGLLIEAVPDMVQLCRKNRPRASVVNTALVASVDIKSVRIRTARLMAYIPGAFETAEEEAVHLENAKRVQGMAQVGEIDVPAQTLSAVLDQQGIGKVDLFSLDVEGYEFPVLQGMDLSRHRPGHLLVETKRPAQITALLGDHYTQLDQLSHHDYLFRALSPK